MLRVIPVITGLIVTTFFIACGQDAEQGALPVQQPPPQAPPIPASSPSAAPAAPMMPSAPPRTPLEPIAASPPGASSKTVAPVPGKAGGPGGGQTPPAIGGLLPGKPGDLTDGQLKGLKPPPGSADIIAKKPVPLPGDSKRGQMKQRRATRVSGNHPITDVNKTLRARNAALKSCYDVGLKADSAIKGALTIRFTIDPKGQVPEAQLTKNDVGPIVGNCFVGRFRQFRFPPSDGSSVFEKTYRFSPAD